MASLVQSVPSVVAPPSMSATESFSQSSTRVEKPSEAPPAAAPPLAKVAEPTAPPAPVATEMKPPAPRDANGSIGSRGHQYNKHNLRSFLPRPRAHLLTRARHYHSTASPRLAASAPSHRSAPSRLLPKANGSRSCPRMSSRLSPTAQANSSKGTSMLRRRRRRHRRRAVGLRGRAS